MADLYMKFGSIKGSATEDGHAGWVALTGLSLGIRSPAYVDFGASGGTMHQDYPEVDEIGIGIQHDQATTQFVKILNNKTVTPEVQIDQVKLAGSTRDVALKIKLKDAMITAIGDLLGGTHELMVSFTAICFECRFYGKDGKIKETHKTGYNLETAKEESW